MSSRRVPSRSRALARLAAASLLASLSCAPAGRPPDLLLVTIDTLRGDRWGCVGDPAARTPAADRLARGGLLAFEGRAPAPLTLPSHASLMTGLAPGAHGVRDNGIFALEEGRGRTIAEVLAAEEWSTAAFVSAFPLARRFGLDRGFGTYDEFLGGEEEAGEHLRQRRANETVDRVRRWFGRRPPDPGRPLFLWVHFFDPHADYVPPAPWTAAASGRPYDGEVAFADRELWRLQALLDETRPGRERRVLVASDHGESLGDHGEATHGLLLHASTLRVPIVVRSEGYAPALSGRPVPLETIARTALELAGVDGELDPAAAESVERYRGVTSAETLYPAFNFGWRGLRAREEDGWKLIAGTRDRLYRTDSDPGETRDVSGEHPEIVARLRRAMEAETALLAGSAPVRTPSAEELESLRALGYLAGGTDAKSLDSAFREGADPADRLHLVEAINRGITFFAAGRLAEAESSFALVHREEPANRLALEYLGRTRLRRGDAAGAREALRQALALGPNPTPVYLDLATAEGALGDLAEQRRTLEEVVALDRRSAQARLALSELLVARGDPGRAASLLEEAAQARPRSTEVRSALARLYEGLGRAEDARAQWEKIVSLDRDGPAGAAAREALARLEKRGGR